MRDLAVTVPTINRARDIFCTLVGVLPIAYWRRADPTNPGGDPTRLPDLTWLDRPDPNTTRAELLAWTVDDLIFHRRSFWRVKTRYKENDFPASFERVPFREIRLDVDYETNVVTKWFWREKEYAVRDLVDFRGITEGVLAVGGRTISIALNLDAAADRFANAEVPAGTLTADPGQEPLTVEELQAAGALFDERRRSHVTAPLQGWTYNPVDWNAEGMQLTEGRQHSALECSRLMNAPAWTVGAPAGSSMTYQNAEQARLDLIDFGAMSYLACIEQTLSGPSITPARTYVKFDLSEWLRNPLLAAPESPAQAPGGDA